MKYEKAIEDSSVVFYVEDADSCRSDFYLCYTIVVQGAKNVINACRECKVKRLIYNSTTDVVADGSHDIHNGDASVPYASTFDNMWSDLKAQAEALILFANHFDGLLTCALRPSNVFGPGDKHLVPFLVDIAKSGWLRFIIGSGENMSDFTYVENAAHALVCAEEALCSRMVSVSGKAHVQVFYYDGPVHSRMNPGRLNHFESVQNIIRLASCTRTFNCSAAEKHIGYTPVVSLEEGIAATIESFSHLAKDSSNARYREFDEQSKVEKLLGSGKDYIGNYCKHMEWSESSNNIIVPRRGLEHIPQVLSGEHRGFGDDQPTMAQTKGSISEYIKEYWALMLEIPEMSKMQRLSVGRHRVAEELTA
ncbi:hypothetical protein RJ639_035201 [Escallonia herrerae]|uniref:3-beta hydroxysteroid dehydrogenase/isomerase domain-containing protein n=1 Tax=Escallonia herrerae TaxID=1293975 RepID=A0AA89BHC1_9ASTE|nr:hypothetical protein RJ639_035201 [Escallonia herrerae]